MKVELQVRWISTGKENKEAREERKLKRLLGKEEEIEDEDVQKYEYHPITVELNDIKTFSEYDKDHTTVGMFGGEFYVIKASYPIIKAFYEFLTGNAIKNIDQFNFSKE